MAASRKFKNFVPHLGQAPSWSRGAKAMPSGPSQGSAIWISSFSINLLGLGMPIVLLQVYDRILPYQATNTLALLIVGLILVLVLDAILNTLRSSVTGWNAARFEHLASCRAVERL